MKKKIAKIVLLLLIVLGAAGSVISAAAISNRTVINEDYRGNYQRLFENEDPFVCRLFDYKNQSHFFYSDIDNKVRNYFKNLEWVEFEQKDDYEDEDNKLPNWIVIGSGEYGLRIYEGSLKIQMHWSDKRNMISIYRNYQIVGFDFSYLGSLIKENANEVHNI